MLFPSFTLQEHVLWRDLAHAVRGGRAVWEDCPAKKCPEAGLVCPERAYICSEAGL